jgi:hypothetical protein
MKKPKSTEEHILFALMKAESVQPVGDVCRHMRVSEAMFYFLKEAV